MALGGLTLALALNQGGFEPDVYEQAPELAEIGAAVALSANSTRELRRPGVFDAVTANLGGVTSLTPTTRLQEDLGLDSLARIDFAITEEDAFRVSGSNEALERFVTVGDVLTFLDKAAQQRPVHFVGRH